MSFIELRNFSEILKILGYPRVVSIENFRVPNFPLVCEILKWFIEKFDPEIKIHNSCENPQDRVELVQNCARLILEKVNIKLNLKKLYQSDGHAVQELLKPAMLLYNSTKETNDIENEDNIINKTQIRNKINEISNARKIASEITLQGADLYDMLTKEIKIRDERNEILSIPIQLSNLEQKLRETIKMTQKNIESINYKIDNVALDESNLDQKIEQKKQELDRQTMRLEQIQMSKPQFQNEFEKLETEFEILYEDYVTKFCSLVHLEDKLEEYDRIETEKFQEQEKKRKDIELNEMTNELDDDENFLEPNETDETTGTQNNHLIQDRKSTSRIKVFGSMTADDEDSFDASFNLEDNEILQDYNEDNSDLDSEDELELMNLTTEKNEDRKQMANNSDNDF